MAMRSGFKKGKRGTKARASSRAKSAKVRRTAATKRARSSAQSRRTVANGEVKFKAVTGFVNTIDLQHFTGNPVSGPGNSAIFLGGMFGGDVTSPTGDGIPGLTQGVGQSEVCGRWYTPAYPDSMKLKIDYQHLQDGVGYAAPAINVRCVTGFIKVTGNKADSTLVNSALWLADCYKIAKRELYESQYSADHLSFTKKSNTVMVLRDFKVTPPKSQLNTASYSQTTPADATVMSFCPPSLLHVTHPQKVRKRKLTPCTDATSLTNKSVVPYDEWMPFTMLLAENLTGASGEGGVRCTAVTKSWFRDA